MPAATLTWADDGDLYTSYGDGFGFEPFVKPKLSMGVAKVVGPPTAFQGINIRSESAERLGDGKKGLKASGMLMVDAVLYMWVRNANNSQIAWSGDHGVSWRWGFRIDKSFGSPAFLNFGKNYEGARDAYVYTFSQDGPSAYGIDDGVTLARVPKGAAQIAEIDGIVEISRDGDTRRMKITSAEIYRDLARRGRLVASEQGLEPPATGVPTPA